MRATSWFSLGIALLLAAPPLADRESAAEPAIHAVPQRLSETGLFIEGSTTTVRQDVMAFSPQYPLWSDGATKRRWIALPEGTVIDASRPDAWEFPRGTRLWKEFAFGRRVETRFIERLNDGSWRFATYVWNEDGTDAVLAPEDGVRALKVSTAPNGRYAIPSEPDCRACHEGAAAPVLGFSALQLSPARDELAPHAEAATTGHLDLRMLAARGLVRNLPQALIDTPPAIEASSATERAVLGYLHANCAHCHNDSNESGAGVPVVTKFEQKAADPSSTALVLGTLIGGSSRFHAAGAEKPLPVVSPGDAQASVLALRMRSRDPRVQMPPIGSAVPDTQALALIERWINDELNEREVSK
jgi:hypothetical protein